MPRYYGPFVVTEVVTPVAYRLKLPKTLKIHDVIHISHLRAYADGSRDFPDRPEYKPPPTPEVIKGEEYFSIEAIRKHRMEGKKLKFLVKWAGYGEQENTWLSAAQMKSDMTPSTFHELLSAYQKHCCTKLPV